jgi:hypothetical protein
VGRNARWRSASVAARRSADGVVAMEWKEMGGEKGFVEISERRCADECGWCGCKGIVGNGFGERLRGDQRA